jgi:ribonuclease HII
MLYFERKLRKQGFKIIIGVDEAGRGPLAGPVVAAAVLLKASRFRNRIDDSKKLTPLARKRAFFEIIDKCVFGVGIVNEKIIDRVNILVATRMAMEQAVALLLDQLKRQKEKYIHIIVDGKLALDTGCTFTCIINGDARSKSIASASILAKVIRDQIMDFYDGVYPGYGFIKHKGYPTRAHVSAIRRLGQSPIHRKSFSFV